MGVQDATGAAEPSPSEREELGALCNAAKYMAAEAAFEACERAGRAGSHICSDSTLLMRLVINSAVMTHGGMGYAADFHVERYLRESFVPRLAPISREMILNYVSQRVLGCMFSLQMKLSDGTNKTPIMLLVPKSY